MEILLILSGFGQRKTKPIQSQTQTKGEFLAYDTTDCRGPSGLAMTSVPLLLCALVPLWL